ncbi:hypothetical protein Q7M_591 [Borrelia crocidurae str. Achema]|uniref:Uncharacterized protein n=1 Tax=Borrelia crocidurae (strain Achema) TaxID=1155096 RepID=I0FD14_BORCA|nr:hypothetical protein Q7M_591 [Borrelia crocidurae str. Achema]
MNNVLVLVFNFVFINAKLSKIWCYCIKIVINVIIVKFTVNDTKIC